MIARIRKGFTLIELLIVMSIIGILMALGAGNFNSARIKARDAKRKSDLDTVAKALEAYANDYNKYPVGVGGLIQCQPSATCDWDQEFTDGKSSYIPRLPIDSSSPEREYSYVSSSGSTYYLYAALENTRDPDIETFTPTVDCGNQNCNYRIKSSNAP